MLKVISLEQSAHLQEPKPKWLMVEFERDLGMWKDRIIAPVHVCSTLCKFAELRTLFCVYCGRESVKYLSILILIMGAQMGKKHTHTHTNKTSELAKSLKKFCWAREATESLGDGGLCSANRPSIGIRR